ncbi:Alanine racemase [Limihaloglobus sulfuriphilus]|uniref:Alanine racemase n=1 Tax=Limihaloglobus sulfuriphilus TaxID=1851148 RepID=A0A1Q2MHR4_9BACT|nr:alanine racemase [Limihaloglobus sulfuriphilus]AQQ72068.1 Alanine racemase [Limihaloglobus sulfuriphilus]
MRKRSNLSLHINSSALLENVRQIRGICGSRVRFCAITKANAYGHGSCEITKLLAQSDIEYFGVFTPDEAFDYAGKVKQKYLALEPVHPDMPGVLLHEAAELGVECTIASLQSAEYAAAMLENTKIPLKVHINIDTGMGRCGIQHEEFPQLLEFVNQQETLKLVGIYTHFPAADEEDLTFTRKQINEFESIISESRGNISNDVILHAANSAAALRLSETRLDMVRCGLGMYGCLSLPEITGIKLKPVMRLTAPIIHIATIKQGQSVSYGRTFTAQRETTIGIVPVGYADGYDLRHSSNAVMKVCGCKAPVIGRVTMSLTVIDLTDIPWASPGASATILDDRPGSPCSAEALAKARGTIVYEVLTSAPADATIIVE